MVQGEKKSVFWKSWRSNMPGSGLWFEALGAGFRSDTDVISGAETDEKSGDVRSGVGSCCGWGWRDSGAETDGWRDSDSESVELGDSVVEVTSSSG